VVATSACARLVSSNERDDASVSDQAIDRDAAADAATDIDANADGNDLAVFDLGAADQCTLLDSGRCFEANQPPTPAPDTVVLAVNSAAVLISVLDNDTDPEGDGIQLIEVGQAARGAATDNGDGTVTYKPAVNESGKR
jgi:hypothetical protein